MNSSSHVIEARGVHKHYRLGVTDHRTLGDTIAGLFGRTDTVMPSTGQVNGRDFWALRDISFGIDQGEVVGVIGRNGAGKSTLLKLLSRITRPTSGSIRMRGRISSLLEVGTGFHPELTGLENIHLNGAILGMRRAEIAAKLEEIIAFAGIGPHLETPIKRYSTGMKVRLGFAVAAHLEPEILVVDEVLAVGDAEFQKRCLGRMRSVADSGRTVLFVSHNMFSVQSLCSRVLWLERGMLQADGPTSDVVRSYLAETNAPNHVRSWEEADAPGTDVLRLRAVEVRALSPEKAFLTTVPVEVEMRLDNLGITDSDLNIQMIVRTEDDVIAFISDMTEAIGTAAWMPGATTVRCTIPADLLNDGGYRIDLLFQRQGARHFLVEDALGFQVMEGPRQGAWFQKWRGALRPRLHWER